MSKSVFTSLGYECSEEGGCLCVGQNVVGTYRDEWFFFTKEDLLLMLSVVEVEEIAPTDSRSD